MTNVDTPDNIQIDSYRYMGQTIAMKIRTRQEVSIRIKAGWSVLLKYREIFLDRHLPLSLKRQVSNQCVSPAMTYGCQTRSLTKALVKKLETSQRATERKMLNVKPKDKIRNTITGQRTRVTDMVKYVTNAKWKWARNIAGMKDNTRTIRSTEWQITGVRSVGRPKHPWRHDIAGRQEAVWIRAAKDRERRKLWRRATSCSGRTRPRIE